MVDVKSPPGRFKELQSMNHYLLGMEVFVGCYHSLLLCPDLFNTLINTFMMEQKEGT